jgi:hypothetical protein
MMVSIAKLITEMSFLILVICFQRSLGFQVITKMENKFLHQDQQNFIVDEKAYGFRNRNNESPTCLFMKENGDDTMKGVIELGFDSEDAIPNVPKPLKSTTEASSASASAPFFSQGDIDPQTLNPDLSDPKQARVIIYIILSLLPVLFLIPLMLGSRELIPLDSLPPVPL